MKFLEKIWQKIKDLFKEGLTPKQLALSITIAILVSVFPIFGITTIVLTAIAVPLKINLPITIAVSYITEPIKFLLVIPFIKVGGYIFKSDHSLLTYDAIKTSYDESFWATVRDLSYELVCGSVGWLLLAVPVGVLVFFILKEIFTYFDKVKKAKIQSN